MSDFPETPPKKIGDILSPGNKTPLNPKFTNEVRKQVLEESKGPRLSKINGRNVIALQEEGYYLDIEFIPKWWKLKIKHCGNSTAQLITHTIILDNIPKLNTSRLAKPIRNVYKALFYEKAETYLNNTIFLLEENGYLFENLESEEEGSARKPESKADRLIRLVRMNDTQLFRDQFHEPYAVIPVQSEASEADSSSISLGSHTYIDNNLGSGGNLNGNSFTSSTEPQFKQTWPVNSQFFKQWMAALMWKADGTAPKKEHINSAITVLCAMANEGPTIDLQNRVASDGNGGFLLDTTNEKWQAIHITKEGWEIITPPIVFRRYPHQLPLCNPSKTAGDVSRLFKYINIGCIGDVERHVNEQLLYLVAFITAFVPDIPHVGTIIHGGAGHIKSMSQILTRRLIDPSSVQYNQLPSTSKITSIIQILTQHYYTVWDNLSNIDGDISDIFCRAITGAAFQLRKLFTDDEAFLRAFKRCVNMNGINIPSDRPDLLDRLLVFEAPYVQMNKRRSESEIIAEFTQDEPIMLGGVLDTLVKAINIQPTIKVDHLPRMADFAKWGCAVSEALGIPHSMFMNAYYQNMLHVKGDVVKSRITGQILINILERRLPKPTDKTPNPRTSIKYLMLDLHKEIVSEAKINEINTNSLPSDPTRLSRELNNIYANLPSLGFSMKKKKTNKGVQVIFNRLQTNTLDQVQEKTESYTNTWKVTDLSELLSK